MTASTTDDEEAIAFLMYGYSLDRDAAGVPEDFPEQAARMLLASAGFTQVTVGGTDYWRRFNRAARAAGVTAVVYGTCDHLRFALAARVVTAYRHSAVYASSAVCADAEQLIVWNRDLDVAVKMLGVKPDHPGPTWRLCSYTSALDDPRRPRDYP